MAPKRRFEKRFLPSAQCTRGLIRARLRPFGDAIRGDRRSDLRLRAPTRLVARDLRFRCPLRTVVVDTQDGDFASSPFEWRL
jgi:hypothetical protein